MRTLRAMAKRTTITHDEQNLIWFEIHIGYTSVIPKRYSLTRFFCDLCWIVDIEFKGPYRGRSSLHNEVDNIYVSKRRVFRTYSSLQLGYAL